MDNNNNNDNYNQHNSKIIMIIKIMIITMINIIILINKTCERLKERCIPFLSFKFVRPGPFAYRHLLILASLADLRALVTVFPIAMPPL